MLKRLITAILTSSMVVSVLPSVIASAENTTANNSVSGYVTTNKTDFELVGDTKSPVIHVDEEDYESVIRAVSDLSDDIESVTDKKSQISNADITSSSEDAEGIEINGSTMTVSLAAPVSADADCYVASYNGNGTLAKIVKAAEAVNPTDGNTSAFSFNEAVTNSTGGKIKAFVWEKNTNKPLTGVLGMKSSEAVDLSGTDIVIGTLGMSDTIDALADNGDIDVSEIADKWESFTVQSVDNTLVIAGSDKRGTIYGIYDLCEKMGVSPWEWWSDVEPVKADELYINLPEGGYTEGEPSVKYRGIFINDEYNLNQWSTVLGNGTAMTHETYEKVFELLLRLKANYLWPAMHAYSPAFHSDEENAALADEYGIVMGSSHCEPLLRNNLGELDDFQDKWETENPDKTLYKALKNESGKAVAYYWTDHDDSGNAVDNKEFLEAYWRESVKNNGGYENVYTLGMRGVHDGSFQTNMDYATALNEIIACQRKIIKEEICDKTGQELSDIPQVFIPYKDVLKYYNNGSLKVPEDVTIMWTDDNYGYVRQNANDAERANSGGTGLYYHISYYGYPTSYLWLSSTQPGLIREELTKTYDMGSDKIWILNVGDLKPAEKEIEYFAKLARNIDETRDTDISDIYTQNAKRDFNMSDADAAEYAEIMDEYYELANSKRPEFQRSGNFSVTAYGDEGQRYIDRYTAITERAEALYEKLSESKKASFYELALYPIRSAKNMAVDYINADRAALYSEQGRGAAINDIAQSANDAAAEIDTDTSYYNTMLDGKWDKIMNINPTKLQGCDAHITTSLNPPTVSELDYTDMEIAVDGQTDLSAAPALTLSTYDTYAKFIDIINTGYGSFDYTVSSSTPAIEISKASGTVYDSDRIYVKLDASKASSEAATITVSRKQNGNVIDTRDIAVTIDKQTEVTDEKTYVETDGTVSIEAEHYTNSVKNGEYEWKVEKDFGRSGDSLKIYPNLATDVADTDIKTKSAYTEYNVYFENSGTYTLTAYRMPTLNERGTMRFAVGIDDTTPTILKGTSTYSGSSSKTDAWAKGVLNNTETLTTTVTVPSSGYHTVRLYNVASGVVIDKMVLTKNAAPYSYFGAPESYNTTYNKVTPTFPVSANDTEVTGIKKTYEPDVLVGNVQVSGDSLNIPIYNLTGKYSSAVVAVTGYDANGNMTSCAIQNADLTSGAATVQVNKPDTANYDITVFDNFTNLQLIAPYKEYGTVVTENDDDSIGIKADLSDYVGKKSITLIADCAITEDITADHIKYLHGENVTKDSYKNIPFADNGEGIYYIRTGIYGESAIDETKNTIINITPDNNGASATLNTWSFASALTDDSGSNPFVLTGGASLEDDGYIKMNTASSGTATMTYTNPVTVSQGGKVTVEFDITYGKLTGKTMTYNITNSDNVSLASVTINAYAPSASVKIGGNEVLEDFSQISDAISRSNNLASGNKPTHYKNVFDFSEGKAYITVSSNGNTAEFSGKLNISANNISAIAFSTNYANGDRACRVDNVSVATQTAPQYAITVNTVNKADNSSVAADITVTDDVSKTAIEPQNGVYMLSEGSYTITAAADGYRTVTYPLELTPALESKEIKIEMVSSADLENANVTIKYVDEENNTIKADVTPSGTYYVGDSFTVSDELTADFTAKDSDGKVNLYKFNSSKSQTEVTLTEDTEITLVFNLVGQYDYYEDFDNYTVVESEWHPGTAKTYPAVSNGVLTYTGGSSSSGAYTTFDEIDCTGKTVKIEADLKFAPTSITGDSQFSIGNTTPAFSSSKVDYGFENSSGHIIGLVHKKGSASFLVNGQSVNTGLIGDWVHMEADADFVSKKVTVKLTNNNGYSAEVKDVDFYSSTVADNIGSMYMRGAGGNGTVSVDNLTIMITGDGVAAQPEVESVLNYKSVYAFGDSIVYGHNAPDNAFMNLIAKKYAMKLTKYAKNGATVMTSSNAIITQVNNASSDAPDFVVFDGYTNDAYGDSATDTFNSDGTNTDVTQHLGTAQGSGATTFDNTTFCGAFEEILYTMKNKWPDSKIVFVTIHKSGARDFDIQTTLHDLTVSMCDEWGVEVVDMFKDCELDTRNADEMAKYIINGAGSHPNVACCNEFYIPMISAKLESLCQTEE